VPIFGVSHMRADRVEALLHLSRSMPAICTLPSSSRIEMRTL
jgi:hypothetical protein